MIFNNYGYHMMDMEFENSIYMILGIGTILLSLIVLTYILIHYNSRSTSRNQLKNEKFEKDSINSNRINIEEMNSGKAKFCHRCGQKLDDRSEKFCPYCGEEI
ncbi:MAG: zinc ribbon domain-containing protein [Candidatus Lokiarchaeia archaeon]